MDYEWTIYYEDDCFTRCTDESMISFVEAGKEQITKIVRKGCE